MDPITQQLQEAVSGQGGAKDTVLYGTGRSGAGRLRNFGAMNDTKFAGVYNAVMREGDDLDAIAAVQAEMKKRQGL